MNNLNNEFYLLRHGQTDYNAKKIHAGTTVDAPLNQTGKEQARDVRNLVAGLPISTILHSPLLRALQTMHLSTRDHDCDRIEIDSLKECGAEVWDKLTSIELDQEPCEETDIFFDQVKLGLEESLNHPGPSLLIAHGGVHYVLCHLLNIEDHSWHIDNCALVHFEQHDGVWSATLV